jgi:hypothetical protein
LRKQIRRKHKYKPFKRKFGNRYNLKFVLLALFGATMGQGVVWYTGQFYHEFYENCNVY